MTETNSRSIHRTIKNALTLLEMVAAMVLAVLLFAALISILRSFSDQQRLVNHQSDQHPPTQILADQLRRDLVGAQSFRQGPDGLFLMGAIAQDWTTRRPTGRRAMVRYRIADINDQPWLVRREVHLDEHSTQRSSEEPVWCGVSIIQLVAPEDIAIDDKDLPPSSMAIGGMRSLPTQVRLVLLRDDGLPLLNLNVVHHWEGS